MLTDTAAVPRCHPLFVWHAPASPIMFALNSTFSSKHLESYQQDNLLFLRLVPLYLRGKAFLKLCQVDYVMFGSVRFGYISFLYFITQKLGTCRIYKRALTGTAAVSISCAYTCLQIRQLYPVVIPYSYDCHTFNHCLLKNSPRR